MYPVVELEAEAVQLGQQAALAPSRELRAVAVVVVTIAIRQAATISTVARRAGTRKAATILASR